MDKEVEIAKAILEMGYDRTNYDKKEVGHVISKAVQIFLVTMDQPCANGNPCPVRKSTNAE